MCLVLLLTAAFAAQDFPDAPRDQWYGEARPNLHACGDLVKPCCARRRSSKREPIAWVTNRIRKDFPYV